MKCPTCKAKIDDNVEVCPWCENVVTRTPLAQPSIPQSVAKLFDTAYEELKGMSSSNLEISVTSFKGSEKDKAIPLLFEEALREIKDPHLSQELVNAEAIENKRIQSRELEAIAKKVEKELAPPNFGLKGIQGASVEAEQFSRPSKRYKYEVPTIPTLLTSGTVNFAITITSSFVIVGSVAAFLDPEIYTDLQSSIFQDSFYIKNLVILSLAILPLAYSTLIGIFYLVFGMGPGEWLTGIRFIGHDDRAAARWRILLRAIASPITWLYFAPLFAASSGRSVMDSVSGCRPSVGFRNF